MFNQRSVAEILGSIRLLGGMIGVQSRAEALAAELEAGLDAIRAATARLPSRPRVYFEEWDDPLISGIRWVSELIGIAGGEDCFPELAAEPMAKRRIIGDPLEVVRRAPQIFIASWCGKRFNPEKVLARPGWDAISAVREGRLYEIKSCDILQPGPAALTDGVRQLHEIIGACA